MIILCMTKIFRKMLRSPCNDIFIQLYTGTLCVLCMEEDFQYFEKYICIYIYWIFCDFIASSYQLGSFRLTKTFMSIMSRLIYCKSLYILFWWACCSPLLSSFITQHQIDKMNRTKLLIRERIGNIPQFSVGVDAVVAEVGTTNRLGFQLLMYQTYVYLWIVIMARKM